MGIMRLEITAMSRLNRLSRGMVKHMEVNDVRAGTKLSESDVQAIVLPNVVPRACSLDIHAETDVDVDNLLVDGVIGFEICDPFENEEYEEVDMKTRGIRLWSSKRGSYGYVIVLLVVLVLFVGFKNAVLVWKEKVKMKEYGEYTPLLGNEDYL